VSAGTPDPAESLPFPSCRRSIATNLRIEAQPLGSAGADCDRLRLKEEEEVVRPAGLRVGSAQVEAAERMGARERSGASPVDVQVADVEALTRLLDAIRVGSEHCAGEAELRVVRDVERVVEVARADD